MSSSSSSDLSSDRTDATAATVNVHDMPSLGFDQPVPAGGYRWWYVDAISDDGAHALTLIAFIGSVFSPYYARARARGVAPAEDYCTVNLALYHAPARWCMTERGRRSLHTTPTSLRIGASGLQLRRTAPEHGNGIEPGHELVIDVDEISTPVPRRLQGRLTVTLPPYEYPPIFLDAQKRHVWQPIAPRTRITVEMKNPALSWRGDAYVDGNRGSVSLESSFRSWEWSRCHPDGGGTVIQYDVIDNDDRHEEKTFRFDAPTDDQPASEQADNADNPGKSDEAGKAAVAPMADRQAPKLRHLQLLDPTRWFRIPRTVRTDGTVPVTDMRTLEDTPFYSRSRFRTSMLGRPCEGMHESLLLRRFDHPITRLLLSFRMPRRAARWLGGPGTDATTAHSSKRIEEPREESRHE